VDAQDLPAGLMTLIKAANRELVLANGGPPGVKALTGLSDGQISRCQGDAYPDLFPSWVAALLEFRSQKPVYARLFATLTQHQVVPIAASDEEEGNLVADLVGVTQAGARVSSALGAALSDNQVTPAEAKGVMAEIGGLERQLDSTKAKLAVVAGGGGRR
jgi:hypothetical protein